MTIKTSTKVTEENFLTQYQHYEQLLRNSKFQQGLVLLLLLDYPVILFLLLQTLLQRCDFANLKTRNARSSPCIMCQNKINASSSLYQPVSEQKKCELVSVLACVRTIEMRVCPCISTCQNKRNANSSLVPVITKEFIISLFIQILLVQGQLLRNSKSFKCNFRQNCNPRKLQTYAKF